MKISEIARRAGVTTEAVRHYVNIGLLKPGRNPDNGYQVFTETELSRLRFVRVARQLGFRLDDIRAIFEDAAHAHSPCPRVRELMAQRLAETRARIAELTALCERMERAMDEWRDMPDSTPDGQRVCQLIESRIHEESQTGTTP